MGYAACFSSFSFPDSTNGKKCSKPIRMMSLSVSGEYFLAREVSFFLVRSSTRATARNSELLFMGAIVTHWNPSCQQ